MEVLEAFADNAVVGKVALSLHGVDDVSQLAARQVLGAEQARPPLVCLQGREADGAARGYLGTQEGERLQGVGARLGPLAARIPEDTDAQDPESRVSGGPPMRATFSENRRGDVPAPVASHEFLGQPSAAEPRSLGFGDFQGAQVILLEASSPLPELKVQGPGLPRLERGAGFQVTWNQTRGSQRGAPGDLLPQGLLVRV